VSMIHVSAVVAPAAVAVAQAVGAGGGDLVAAFVAGAETTTRVGMALPGAFHERGLHPTSVCGVFGATVAAARLLGLTREQLVSALGIAGSTASGLFEFLADGSATKPFHAGWAAHAGIVSAGLARDGLTGPATVLEGRYGIFRALLGADAGDELRAQVGDLGRRWETLAIAIKPYPACHMTHAAMDGALRLREGGLRAADVESVELEVPTAAVGLVLEPAERKERPQTAYEAKFSLPFSVGAMLVDGSVGPATYAGGRLRDPEILELARRVEYRVAPVDDRGPFFTLMRVTRTDGSTVEVDVAHPSGTPEAPLAPAAVMAKFVSNASERLGERVDKVAEAILEIDTLPGVPPLFAAAVGAR
jgi:2-methylcitrate dehydratase PrpD